MTPGRLTVAGHDLTIFVETWPCLNAMLDDIRAARQRVWLESYIFQHDPAGRAVAAALEERARAGVQVRLLYDAIGSQTTPAWFWTRLRRAGVRVHPFHSVLEAFWRFSFLRILNLRDHRKLLVIDDRIAYFGGMNIMDPSSGEVEAAHLPSPAGWRDVHMRLEGPQQQEVAASFERAWLRARRQKTPPRVRPTFAAPIGAETESIEFFDTGPGLRGTSAGRLFTWLIGQARHSITMAMAYFLPVGRVMRALFRARRSGVLVHVLVPGVSDAPVVLYASRHLYDRLLRRRFHIHERQGIMLHSKVMIVDDEWTVVGSANLDARSLWINLEFVAVIRSRRLAQALNEIVAFEMMHSKRITVREYRELSWWERLRNRLAWELRWWL
jgi:cardiolipin synthase